MIKMAHSQSCRFSSTVTTSNFHHFNSVPQPTNPISGAVLKDISLRAITNEQNVSGLCRQSAVWLHQHKIRTIHKVTTIASNHSTSQQSKLNTWPRTDNIWTGIIVVHVLYKHMKIYYCYCITLLYSYWSRARNQSKKSWNEMLSGGPHLVKLAWICCIMLYDNIGQASKPNFHASFRTEGGLSRKRLGKYDIVMYRRK